ncbi:hypothetical protein E4U43_000524 [Claviceps pusilla]|uniref:NmrA-like domain-containing protein n=1 Tax=Claviceps pusilla TaxID=123648 RepID=A0A9P7NAJ0_9HYPO|nr:hypothetical protein E4U43_000524 [Claviceps pusilla]
MDYTSQKSSRRKLCRIQLVPENPGPEERLQQLRLARGGQRVAQTMMRIAVAGGGGFGYLLALQLSQAAAVYNIVILSRSQRPEFSQFDLQLHVVDYSNPDSLTFALQGVDLVISTISGPEQLNLINASAIARVRVFVPSEYEGSVSKRPSHDDPLDRGSMQALALLKYWEGSTGMRYTVFTCGIFMERFHPYGLGYLNIGYGTGVSGVGDYLVDFNNGTAEYAEKNARGHTVRVCLTSVYDVVRFIVAAIDLGPRNWPHEFTMRGDRMSVRDVVKTCSRVKNGKTPTLPALAGRWEMLIDSAGRPRIANLAFEHRVRQPYDLQALLNFSAQAGDAERLARYKQLVATTNGRYGFSKASLNEILEKSGHADVQPMNLTRWLTNVWQSL